MKKLLLAAALLFSAPVYAQQSSTNYQPFRYETSCALMYEGEPMTDLCVVIETREKGGALRTRRSVRLENLVSGLRLCLVFICKT